MVSGKPNTREKSRFICTLKDGIRQGSFWFLATLLAEILNYAIPKNEAELLSFSLLFATADGTAKETRQFPLRIKKRVDVKQLSHSHETSDRIVEIKGSDIPEINLMDHLKPAETLLEKTTEYFFSSEKFSANAPFKGFLINGPVGIGKTELVRQIARKVALNLQGKADVRLIPVDSSIVASPKWGESEQVFQSLFSYVKNIHHTANNPKVILLFDDIESLLLARGMSAAREWHYSLNAVFFHLVDSMNPFESMVFATTNRVDLMDSAVTTRLYSVALSNVPLKELMRYTSGMLESMLGPGPKKDVVLEVVGERLKTFDKPTIRDCRQLAIISCIEKGVLSDS